MSEYQKFYYKGRRIGPCQARFIATRWLLDRYGLYGLMFYDGGRLVGKMLTGLFL